MLRPGDDAAAVAEAARVLAGGGLVGLPTETVYGLAARADRDEAVAAVFERKGRPSDHPLIVHIADPADATHFTEALPALARRLGEAFWPGPLTVIVPRRPGMAGAAAAGQATIGLRCPSHPVAQALLRAARELGVPGIAAPSANRFGRISPTRAAHVVEEFGDDLLVLDGGECAVGIESAIVDCSRSHPVLLRPGQIGRDRLEAAAGERLREPDDEAPRAPGTLEAHYAPRARLRLMPAGMLNTALQLLGPAEIKLALYSRTVRLPPGARLRFKSMPSRAEDCAHELFAALRELDAQGVDLIWVEEPPPGPEWDGVRDRLQRAAAA
ncbi:MAG: threonylcarbamoyl-AMP synthase [Piscinibacter sp.]|nr:threonylcarbamoyl-AMP synthase [Piscinibacter sp.]